MKFSKNIIIIILLLIIIAGGITWFYSFRKPYIIKNENFKNIWAAYDKDLEIIKSNLSEISVSNENWEWWVLKLTNINDEFLLNTHNYILANIRMYYISTTDDGTFYTN